MVLAWILNSVHEDIANIVSYYTSAADVWVDLHDRFSQGNDSRVYQIKRKIVEHRQEQQSISVYYMKLKALWDELASYHELPTCSCGGLKKINERDDKEMVMQILMGLKESYVVVCGKILLMQPLPDTRKAYSLFYNKRNKWRNSRATSQWVTHPRSVLASFSLSFGSENKARAFLGWVTHWEVAREFPKTKSWGNGKAQSGQYHATVVERARDVVDSGRVMTIQPGVHHVPSSLHHRSIILSALGPDHALTVLFLGTHTRTSQWITHHGSALVRYSLNFGVPVNSETSELPKSLVLGRDENIHLRITHLGDVGCYTIDSVGSVQVTPLIKLDDVLHVPNFRVYLLFVSKLTESLQCIVIFFPTFCVIQNMDTRRTIGLGK
ncbi:uncharacterized protein [Malus domestica]|uniref:uncharacterized protein n=1 Tax=Malus domestica TaxID=3750 RepID=UPI0039769432